MQPLSIVDRFWSKVDKTSGCWLWTASTDERTGYGWFRLDGRMCKAHRIAWSFAYGVIPAGQQVLHSCDNPPCVKLDHLFLGTQADNIKDCQQKGRTSRGENHRSAKLTEAQVLLIYELLRSGQSQSETARQFGVSKMSLWCIAKGRHWSHLYAQQVGQEPSCSL